jgi:integrase
VFYRTKFVKTAISGFNRTKFVQNFVTLSGWLKLSKTMKTQSQFTTTKSGTYEYIYVYFRLNNQVLRIKTGNRVIKGKMTKDNLYTTSVTNYAALNQAMREIKRRVDNYITTQLSSVKPIIDQKDCEAYIDEKNWLRFGENMAIYKPALPKIAEESGKSLLEYYTDFFDYKQRELAYSIGCKDYKSLNNALNDYQTDIGKSLQLSDVNMNFMIDFRNFLVAEHKQYKTKGGMNDNTVNKRFICLKAFFSWLDYNNHSTIKKEVYDFKAPAYAPDIFALTKEDIKAMQAVQTENKTHRKVLDFLILNCFLGLRYADFCLLKKEYFKQDNEGDYYLNLINTKTGTEITVPLGKTAREILERYDFNLTITTGQNFNRMITEVLKKYDLFADTVITHRRVNRVIITETKIRRDVYRFHTGRRSFITIAANQNIPLPNLMIATGHRKIATLQRYMQRSTSKEQFKKMDLD